MGVIEDLYRNILGREGREEGLTFWNNALNNGVSLERIRQEFYESPEYKNIQATRNAAAPVAASSVQWTDSNNLSGPAGGLMRHGEAERLRSTQQSLDNLERTAPTIAAKYGEVSYDALYGEYSAWQNSSAGMGIDGSPRTSGSYYSNVLGREVSASVSTDWTDVQRQGDYTTRDTVNFSFTDNELNRDGYYTGIYKGLDGTTHVLESEKGNEWDFVRDMVYFAAAAFQMYTGLTALGGAMGGSGATAAAEASGASAAGSGAAGAGELTLTEAMVTYAPDFAGEVAAAGMGDAGFAVGLTDAAVADAAVQGGFQVSKLGAPWEQVGGNALGSGLNGIDTVDGLLKLGAAGADGSFSLGGMTLLPDGTLLTTADMFSATAPWINPGSSTITDVVINSAGSVGNLMTGVDPWSLYAAGLGDVLPSSPPGSPPPAAGTEGAEGAGGGSGSGGGNIPPAGGTVTDGSNWWDDVLDTVTDIGAGVVVGSVLDSVINSGSTPSPTGTQTGSGYTINIPRPEPSAAALQPASSQRAGVRFGRTKSKRQLRGKFSGTGFSL